MKKIFYLGILMLTPWLTQGQGVPCFNQMLLNSDFTSGLTNWTQYGQVATATVLPGGTGCLNNFAALQATSGGSVGIRQAVTFKRDSCYSLCYCVEFPGSTFNARLVVAAVNPGVTPTMLLTGAFTPSQAMIIDTIIATSGIASYMQCPVDFQTANSYTGIVFINQTVGNIGSDVRIDNICLQPVACKKREPSCDSVIANFSYAVPSGTTANFTDLSTFNPGDVVSWSWDFGDPPSGVNNTSLLQNPSHTYPMPGAYLACLYVTSILTNGLQCQDTFCVDLIVPDKTGITVRDEKSKFILYPNPASRTVEISGSNTIDLFEVFDLQGKLIFVASPQLNKVNLPYNLPQGVYTTILTSEKGKQHVKLMIDKIE